jgi:hypothetical protein
MSSNPVESYLKDLAEIYRTADGVTVNRRTSVPLPNVRPIKNV